MEIPDGSIKRSWTPDELIWDVASSSNLRVMSYNILDDTFICSNKYRYCPCDKLYMQGRHCRIVQEIAQVDPDVVCLQEVAKAHFDKNLSPDLKKLGYFGIHMNFTKPAAQDGLAIFFKKRNIALLDKASCPTQSSIQKCIPKSTSDEDRADIMEIARHTQGSLLAKCCHIPSGRTFCIANIHIGWTRFLLPAVSALEAACAVTILNRFANGLPYIITGDFNSTPDFAPYNLMATGEFDYSVDHWNTKPLFDLFPWSDEEVCNMTVKVPSQPLLKVDNHPRFSEKDICTDQKLFKLMPDAFRTNAPLVSAYKLVTGYEPITNCEADDWKGYVHELRLDYMWFTDRGFAAKRVLETPSRDLMRKYHALPSQLMPSDHIAIATEFQLI